MYLAHQAVALLEAGADFIIFETLPSRQAALEARKAMKTISLQFDDTAFVLSHSMPDGEATAEEIKMLGYDLYTQYVPQEDLAILKEINEAVFRQFECITDTERIKYSISYDFHFVINGVKRW